jgi:hypothetical protein
MESGALDTFLTSLNQNYIGHHEKIDLIAKKLRESADNKMYVLYAVYAAAKWKIATGTDTLRVWEENSVFVEASHILPSAFLHVPLFFCCTIHAFVFHVQL